MYKKGAGNDKQEKDPGNRTLCPYRNFSQAIKPGIIGNCLSRLDDHAQQYELSVMAKTKKMVQVLLDFIVNWREFYDHSYFRDLTSNQRRLEK